ncbi:hypothetical protein [Acinetobacter sp. CFCC 10889]|uniref:hypothetical protein n=1 Tax=Acinetobacter sp. CFCC 10889 TaxID=1775557 RepID=UPI000DD08DE1|nr:hypothetical protein [Acinetobacter sp. CFCC 10889]
MSLEKNSTHVRLSPENHKRAQVLSNIKGKNLAQYLAWLLEKEIAGEWHILNIEQRNLERLGIAGLLRELSTEVEINEGLEGIHGDLSKEKA